jgi:hypothetical protein
VVYSKRLIGPLVPGAGITAIATVPVGVVWVIKRICVVNYGAAITFPTLYKTAFAAANTMWQWPGGLAAGAALDTETRVIFNASEVVAWAGNNAASLAIYGFELVAA